MSKYEEKALNALDRMCYDCQCKINPHHPEDLPHRKCEKAWKAYQYWNYKLQMMKDGE
jgi:hypothetical protein